MQEHYDAIILGTGLKECIVSGLLSVAGKKVLHMDRNQYYGGESASLNLTEFLEHFNANIEEVKAKLPQSRNCDWNIDLIPKFILADSQTMDLLKYTTVDKYLDFGLVAGSFVVHKNKIEKVPTTAADALKSPLLGLLEKKRMASMLMAISDYFQKDTPLCFDPKVTTTAQFFEKYKLAPETQNFIMHGMALQLNDDCLTQPAYDTFNKIYHYASSLNKYGQSPFIYPLYGLGDLPQSFSRLSAVWGGTYMLNKPIDKFLYNEDGTFKGVVSNGEEVYADICVCDPSYAPDLVKSTGKIGRGICFLKGPIQECAQKSEIKVNKKGEKIYQTSAQIIITPQAAHNNRKDDIYVTTQGYNHRTTPQGVCLGFVSGTVESDDINELESGWKILEQAGIIEKYYTVQYMLEPTGEGESKNIYVSKSYDATSHFETTVQDAVEIYERIMKTKLVFDNGKKIQPGELEENNQQVE